MAFITRRRFLTGLGAAGSLGYASAYEAGWALELTSYQLTPPLSRI